MTLVEIHSRLANSVLFYALAMGIWGFWRYFRRKGVDSSYFGALVIAEILIIAQGLLGAYLYVVRALRPAQSGMHILYGVVSLLAIPTIYSYTRGSEERREMLYYALGLLFLVGIAFRSIATGGG
jgi:uncharacterized membrane protein YfcA